MTAIDAPPRNAAIFLRHLKKLDDKLLYLNEGQEDATRPVVLDNEYHIRRELEFLARKLDKIFFLCQEHFEDVLYWEDDEKKIEHFLKKLKKRIVSLGRRMAAVDHASKQILADDLAVLLAVGYMEVFGDIQTWLRRVIDFLSERIESGSSGRLLKAGSVRLHGSPFAIEFHESPSLSCLCSALAMELDCESKYVMALVAGVFIGTLL